MAAKAARSCHGRAWGLMQFGCDFFSSSSTGSGGPGIGLSSQNGRSIHREVTLVLSPSPVMKSTNTNTLGAPDLPPEEPTQVTEHAIALLQTQGINQICRVIENI